MRHSTTMESPVIGRAGVRVVPSQAGVPDQAGLEPVYPGSVPNPTAHSASLAASDPYGCTNSTTPATGTEKIVDGAPFAPELIPPKTDTESGGTPKKSRRRRWLWSGALAALTVVGAVVGGAVGGTIGRRSASPSHPPTSTDPSSPIVGGPSNSSPPAPFPTSGPRGSTSSCRGGVCPRALQIVTVPETARSYLFGMTSERTLAYRVGSGGNGSTTWDTSWVDLGGEFLYPPSAAPRRGGYVEVVGVGTDGGMYWRSLVASRGTWSPTWYRLAGEWAGAPTAHGKTMDGWFDFWALQASGGIGHAYALLPTDGTDVGPQSANWTTDLVAGPLAGALAVQPALDPNKYILFKRAANNTLQAYRYGDAWTDLGGNLTSSPTVVSSKSAWMDVFALGPGGYPCWLGYRGGWLSWVCVGEVAMESIVDAVVLGAGRVDVVALGRDDHFYHRSLSSQNWGAAWDNLGGPLNSAPVVASFRPNTATVFGIGLDEQVYTAEWDASAFIWVGNTSWIALGGNFTTTIE